MTTTTNAKIAKNETLFCDDLWRQIKGFLFNPDIMCKSCELKLTEKNCNDFKLVKRIKGSIRIFSKLTGNNYDIYDNPALACSQIKLVEIGRMPLYMNIEDILIPQISNKEIKNKWYCKKCWSSVIFDPYVLSYPISDYLKTNDSSVIKKEQHKLFNLFKGINCKSIFDKQRLSATNEKYQYYIKCMERGLIKSYKEDLNRFDNRFDNCITYTKNYIKRECFLHNYKKRAHIGRFIMEFWVKLAIKEYSKNKLTYNQFKKIIREISMAGEDGYAYSEYEVLKQHSGI